MLKGTRHIMGLALALGMMLYAVPRLDFSGGWTLASVFGAGWIAFALLVIAAHLHELLGVEEETKRELLKIKRMKKWRLEQSLQGRRSLLQIKR
nr:hypothetical protein [Paenibacillus tianmuensis]